MRHIPELEGLRAIAAIMVLTMHAHWVAFTGGYIGVDIFFVLSGYLTCSIAMSGRYTPGAFILRRVLRIWPLLLFVSIIVAAALFAADQPVLPQVLPFALIFGAPYFLVDGRTTPLDHTWTLLLEMLFYLLIAFAVRYNVRRVALAGFVFCTVLRFWMCSADQMLLAYFLPGPHSSGLFLGALIATLPRLRVPADNVVLTGSFLVFALCALTGVNSNAFGIAWVTMFAELATAAIILAVTGSNIPTVAAFLRRSTIRFLGRISYGIYLWHFPVALALDTGTWLDIPVTIAFSVALAALTYPLVEKPFLLLRRSQNRPGKGFILSEPPDFHKKNRPGSLWTASAPTTEPSERQ